MIRITGLEEEDLPQLALLYRELIDRESYPEKMRNVFRTMRDNPHYIVLVARKRDRLVGTVMGVLCLDLFGECRPFMVIENMVVSESCRQSGVGSLLLKELEKRATAHDCHYILLVSAAGRQGAHAFYEKLGYDRNGVRGFKKYLQCRS